MAGRRIRGRVAQPSRGKDEQVAGLAGSGKAPGRDAGKARGRDAGTESGLDADPEAVARQICLRLLSAAPRTKAQLADALRRRGVPDDAAANVLERFAEVKLIDDELFARA